MTAVETELNTQLISTNWISNNSMAIVKVLNATEDDSIIELHRFLRPQSPVQSSIAGEALTVSSSRYVGGSPLFGFQRNRRHIVARSLFNESATDTLMTAVPNVVQAFFLRAESQLLAETEITAQVALKLLRRIKALVVNICPKGLPGRVLAFVDAEDRSTTIEWIGKRSRLGFVLDRENESSWFMVLPNGLSKSGYLYRDSGLKSLRGLLEEFIAAGE